MNIFYFTKKKKKKKKELKKKIIFIKNKMIFKIVKIKINNKVYK